jgi:hypothetical protein
MIKEIQQDLEELLNSKPISRCITLNESIPENEPKLQPNYLPLYFTGDLNADYVTVDLNPRKSPMLSFVKNKSLSKEITDLKSYQSFCLNFAKHKYDYFNRTKAESFDMNWIRFFYGFGTLNEKYESSNLEKVIEFRNSKLQLEFIPYCSESININNFSNSYLEKRTQQILKTINSKPRKGVFITGKKNKISTIFNVSEASFKPVGYNNRNDVKMAFKTIKGQPIYFLSTYKSYSISKEKYGKACSKALNN